MDSKLPKQDHSLQEGGAGLTALIRFRCESALKKQFKAIAKELHRSPASLAREILWAYVENPSHIVREAGADAPLTVRGTKRKR